MHSIALILAMLTIMVQAQKGSAELEAVLDRAAQYVALYLDDQLGNVSSAENYRQVSVTFSPTKVRLEEERRIESDFLIYRQGNSRIGLRIVRRVDRVEVPVGDVTFNVLRDNSPEGIQKGISALVQQSARYNIGGVRRTFNVPTFALNVVRKAELPYFDFEKRGIDKINGVQVWEVAFKERKERPAPTLVRGDLEVSLFSWGSIWIDPATGRILKTDFQVENPYSKPKAKGRVTVTYTESKVLHMHLPSQMMERYETEDGFIEGRADYTNFLLFGVDVKSEIASPNPPVR
jgi:hypothetical protein